jgi:NAD(P)-dependent dehydrogenase (short-subunit alcohol dehydrogenase family)
VVLVTGANRGIGRALCDSFTSHGAAKIYAAARDPDRIVDERFTRLRLDVTDSACVADAARIATDVTIVVNNAGVSGVGSPLLGGSLDAARKAMEVNFFGTWAISRAFAPSLAANHGGAIVNILSAASWWATPGAPGYSASKAAAWSLTNALREGLQEQGTRVLGVHCGYVDTDLSSWTDAPKITAETVAEETIKALLDDVDETLLDEFTRATRRALAGDVAQLQRIAPTTAASGGVQ